VSATTVSSPWEVFSDHFPMTLPKQQQLRFLLQYAILAPSTKNTQPWRFSVGEDTIGIFADLSRCQPVADRGGRELYISLGCALENLLVAIEDFGFGHSVKYLPHSGNDELAATVTVHPGGVRSVYRIGLPLSSITQRRTQHGLYANKPVTASSRNRLLHCCEDLGVRIDLIDDPAIRARVIELNLHADEMEFADPRFRKELGYWVGQGVFGTPRVLSKLGQALLSKVNLGRAIGKRNAATLASAPLIGMIRTDSDDRASQIRAGQALERLWLHATAMGIALQPMSQALEIPSLRAELGQVIPQNGWTPQQVFRLGYALKPRGDHTPRRPVAEVLLG
jgi:nitroreductase